MMEFHDDYESQEAKFIELATENPTLRDMANKSSNPAKFAYDQAKKHQEFSKVQNIDTYKAELRAELKAEIEAEMNGTSMDIIHMAGIFIMTLLASQDFELR